jgi:hypothetical protein
MSTSIKIEVPTWDGKRDTFDTYVYKLRAYAAIKKIIDALDEAKMRACITQAEYDALVAGATSTLGDVAAKKLFKDNEELTGIYVLGQLSQAGINAIRKTVSDDFPLGKVVEAIKSLSLVNKPADRTAEIEMESEVQKVVFKNANDYFTEVTDILAQFDCTMSEINLLKDMAKKTKNTTYIKMIHDEMDVASPSFQKACLEIHKLQRMVNVSNKTEEKKVKEVTLTNVGTGNPKGPKVTKCSHCQGSHSRKECTKLKELLKKQGKCPHCNKEGHLKDECFAKYPEKKPKWMKGKFGGSGGAEVSAGNLEIQLASVDGQDF